jgi:hypothetical protein
MDDRSGQLNVKLEAGPIGDVSLVDVELGDLLPLVDLRLQTFGQ